MNPSFSFSMSPPQALILSRAASSGTFSSRCADTASPSSSPPTTWTKPSAAATSPTFISANSSPTARPIRSASFPTFSLTGRCASKSPLPRSPARFEDHFDLNDLREQLLKNGIAVAEIRPLAPSLEDVFVELTYKHQALLEAAHA